MISAGRRFPPPWSIEDIGAAFVAKSSGISIARRRPGHAVDSEMHTNGEARIEICAVVVRVVGLKPLMAFRTVEKLLAKAQNDYRLIREAVGRKAQKAPGIRAPV